MKSIHRTPLYLSFCTAILISSQSYGAKNEKAEKEIQYLIESIASSGCNFERNGDIHSAKDAASHLNRKLGNAKSSWFAPSEDKWTAELFIEKVASGSSLSGKPYYIKCKEKASKAGEWLKGKLEEYRQKSSQGKDGKKQGKKIPASQ